MDKFLPPVEKTAPQLDVLQVGEVWREPFTFEERRIADKLIENERRRPREVAQ